ncbi:MAG: hypothetical protein Ct9H90mP2_14090 [Dehalococcoidia bacterium]|nr:MAG: hypothetical protein Ct9H90mP2_14090 [Dehalococcoidia bacterium]
MPVLEKGIQDYKNNITRFAVVSNSKSKRSEMIKRLLHLNSKNQMKGGLLFKALECFAKKNINLVKIESRPKRGLDWELYFYNRF